MLCVTDITIQHDHIILVCLVGIVPKMEENSGPALLVPDWSSACALIMLSLLIFPLVFVKDHPYKELIS